MSAGLRFLVENLPYGFCPGCSHGLVTDALGAALARLSPERHHVAVVSDIGCVGLIDKHLDLNTFHGLHGRSVTYATGLKLARPDLQVFVVIGDGGTGIGGHHLIQAARRGVDLTVVVFNNFNYGMTGGEHSSTTPQGAVTSSTPGGNAERPMDLCAIAMAAGATFVARATAFDRDLPALVARAAEHPGFALVDVWEICTAYYMPFNHFKKKDMERLSDELGMPFGVLRDAAVARHPAQAGTVAATKPVLIEPVLTATLERPVGVLIAGAAGQKIKSAATTLARAAIRAGLRATQKDDYPITVKTGHSVAELILSPRPIRFTALERPDIAIVLSREGLLRKRTVLEGMDGAGVIYVDAALRSELGATGARVVEVDYQAASRDVGRENLPLWAIARMLAVVPSVPRESFLESVMRWTPERYRQAAMRAAEQGASA